MALAKAPFDRAEDKLDARVVQYAPKVALE